MSLIGDIVIRYSLKREQSGFTRLVARASMLGMVLGVASLITVMSVMNGFAAELHGRILALVPHGIVLSDQGSIDDWRALADRLDLQGARGVSPFITDTVMLQSWGRQRGARLTGIDLQQQRTVTALHEHIVQGDLAALETTPFSVVLGETLSRILGVRVGDDIEVILPTLSVTPIGVFPRTRKLTVVAVFKVGADLDAKQAWVSLDTGRRLFARTGVDGLHLQFDSMEAAKQRVPQVAAGLPGGLSISDWQSTQGSLFTAVRMEKITVAILLMAVVVVAAFNIVSTLTMSVTEKQGDIAVLRVMGLSSRSILLIFIGHGMVLGGVGILIGGALGIALALNISDLALWLEQLSGTNLFDPQVYYIGRLPAVLEWSDVAVTAAAALLLSLGATVYPAWRASRIHPVEILNNG